MPSKKNETVEVEVAVDRFTASRVEKLAKSRRLTAEEATVSILVSILKKRCNTPRRKYRFAEKV